MTEALLIAGAVLIVAAFVGGIFAGRRLATTGAPTPPTANAVAQEQVDDEQNSDNAEDKALQDAKDKAAEVMHESDADIAARVAQLRARGRAGE